MTKLEELSTLLVNEIKDFNKGITRLDSVNKEIHTTKIQMDLTEYKSIIQEHQQKMKELVSGQERFESRFNNKLKQAKIYPNWAVIVFIISLMLCIGSILYAYKVKKDMSLLGKKACTKSTNTNFQSFFKAYPKSKQAFEK